MKHDAMTRGRWIALMLTCSLGLAACSADQDELQHWMEQQKREVKPTVEPLSPPKKFTPSSCIALRFTSANRTLSIT